MSGLLRPTTIGEVPGDGVRRPGSSDVAPPAEGTVQPTENTRTGADAEAPPAEETRATAEDAQPTAPAAAPAPDPEVTQPLSPAEEPSGGFGLASAPTG